MSEERLAKVEERLLEVETKLGSLDSGQSIVYGVLERAGLMKSGEPTQSADWNPNNIKWVAAEGAKGPYQRYPRQGQKAESTADYRNMLADLKKRGKVRDGYWYWVFTDGATLGRKLRKGKHQVSESPKAHVEPIKAKFPSDLAELLTFEVEGQFHIIKPRQFLGSDNFSKIAAVVRNLSGEYVSAGKNSHFKVPVNQ